MFGYPIEPDFDSLKETRRDHVKSAIVAALVFSIIYGIMGRPFAVEVFQGLFATVLCYGIPFYVEQGENLRKPWVWRAISATLPLHVIYLGILFWSDHAFPSAMRKVVTFMPVLVVGFGVELFFTDRIVGHFKPVD